MSTKKEAGKASNNSDPPGIKEGLPQATASKLPLSSKPSTSNAAEETKEGEMSKGRIFNSQDFMNFLTTHVDIANIMVETKDGERFKASFPGSSMINSGDGTAPDDGPPKSIFKSLDMLKDLGMVDGDTELDPTILQSTVSLEYFPPNPNSMARSASAGTGPSAAEAFASRDWAADYQNSHVEVSYSNCFDGAKNGIGGGGGDRESENGVNNNLPPKKRAPTNNRGDDPWNDMFKKALDPLLNAVSVAHREHSGDSTAAPAAGESAMSSSNSQSQKKRQGRRKPRKVIPEVKTFCDFTEKDVLFGRGGRSNHHGGNKVYRDIVTKHQEHYRSCDKNEKTKVAQGIVDCMKNEIGARFLELDKDTNRWYLVPNVVARRKVGQALRENNTEEARAAKRAKYHGRYSSAAGKKAAEVNAAAAKNLASRPGASAAHHLSTTTTSRHPLSTQV